MSRRRSRGGPGFAIHPVEAFSFGPSIVVGGAPLQDFPFSLSTLLSIGFSVGIHVGIGEPRALR